MPFSRRALPSLTVAVSGALLLAACGGSSGTSNAAGTTGVVSSAPASSSAAPSSSAGTSSAPSASSATPGSGTASSSAPATATKAKLLAIGLQASDLGTGWKSNPSSSDSDDNSGQAELVACVGGKNTDPDKVLDVDSPDFTSGTATISSSVTSYKSDSDIDADVALLKNPKVSGCFEKEAKAEVADAAGSGATLKNITFKVTPGAVAGISNVAGTGTGSITAVSGGKSVTIYIGVVFITGPKLEAEVDFETVGQAVPAASRNQIIAKVAARAAKG